MEGRGRGLVVIFRGIPTGRANTVGDADLVLRMGIDSLAVLLLYAAYLVGLYLLT